MQSVTSNAVYNKTVMSVENISGAISNSTSSTPWTAPHNGIMFVRAAVTSTSTSNNKVYYIQDKTLNIEYGNYNSQPAQVFSFSLPIIKGNEYYQRSAQNINNVWIRALYIGD